MDKHINNKKKTKLILAGLAAMIVLFGAVMMIVTASGSGETSEKKEKTEETAAVEEKTEGTAVSKLVISDIPAYAEEVYSCKVDDINNTVSVALLLETMKLEDTAGKYTVEIAPEGDIDVLTVTAEPVVKAEMKRAYDDNMEICAQQLLALIPEIDQVTWIYPVAGAEDKEEKASVSVAAEAASNAAGEDIRSFGESQKAFEQLVKMQMKK